MKRFFLPALAAVVCALASSGPSGSAERAGIEYYFNQDDIRALEPWGDTLLLGTSGGVMAYDLLSDEIRWNMTVLEGLPSNSVRALARDGSLVYVGTDRGLCLLDPSSRRVIDRWTGGRFERIRALEIGEDGRLFVGTYGSGAFFLGSGRVRYFVDADSVVGNKILSLLKLEGGPLFFATSRGLFSLFDTLWTGYQAGRGIPRGATGNLIEGEAGRVYFSVEGRGIYLLGGKRAVRIGAPPFFPGKEVAAIALSPDGALWAAGRYGGIGRYQYGFWTGIGEEDPEIAGTSWRCAAADSAGNVFFGSSAGLFLHVSDEGIWKRRLRSSIPPGETRGFTEDSTGAVFFRCGGRLVRFESGAFFRETPPGPAFSLASSPEGRLFLATRWGVFERHAGRGFVELPLDRELVSDHPVSLAAPGGGRLWAATSGGAVFLLREGLWLRLGDPEEVALRSPEGLIEDAAGRLWVLGRGRGVSLFDGLGWKSFGDTAFSGELPVDMCLDGEGRLLLAAGTSLWRFAGRGAWRRIGPADAGGSIEAVTHGREGVLVVSERAIISIVSGREKRFDRTSFLGTAEVADMFVDREGSLWFGLREGGVVRVGAGRVAEILFE